MTQTQHTPGPAEHLFVPVPHQSGCKCCGFARGEHPNRKSVRAAMPWKPVHTEELDDNTYRMMDANSDGQAIVHVLDTPSGDRALALIASAPALLEALKRYVSWQEGAFDAIDIEAEILNPARAAIAKAEERK